MLTLLTFVNLEKTYLYTCEEKYNNENDTCLVTRDDGKEETYVCTTKRDFAIVSILVGMMMNKVLKTAHILLALTRSYPHQYAELSGFKKFVVHILFGT